MIPYSCLVLDWADEEMDGLGGQAQEKFYGECRSSAREGFFESLDTKHIRLATELVCF